MRKAESCSFLFFEKYFRMLLLPKIRKNAADKIICRTCVILCRTCDTFVAAIIILDIVEVHLKKNFIYFNLAL